MRLSFSARKVKPKRWLPSNGSLLTYKLGTGWRDPARFFSCNPSRVSSDPTLKKNFVHLVHDLAHTLRYMEVNIHEAKTNFSKLLQRAAFGEEIIIAKAEFRWQNWCRCMHNKARGRSDF